METSILNKARQALTSRGLDAALLDDPISITWVTGYAPNVVHGPNAFEGGPPLLWLDGEQIVLLVSDAEQAAAEAAGVQTQVYTGYQIESPLAPLDAMLAAFDDLLKRLPRPHKLGLENLPLRFWQALHRRWPDLEIEVMGRWTAPLRAVKTPAEIEKIHAACKLSSLAQAVLRSAPLVNRSELEIFDILLHAMEKQAGTRLTVLADLVAGVRTAGIGGMPTSYIVQANDPVLADIVPRLDGYWGDICNVRFAGEPSERLRALYRAAHTALFMTIEAARPGRRANELDQIARQMIARQGFIPHPHHTGHGLGVANHEEPRICAYNDAVLEPGMVIALEPGIYVESVGGVRLEHVILITDNEPRFLTEHVMEA